MKLKDITEFIKESKQVDEGKDVNSSSLSNMFSGEDLQHIRNMNVGDHSVVSGKDGKNYKVHFVKGSKGIKLSDKDTRVYRIDESKISEISNIISNLNKNIKSLESQIKSGNYQKEYIDNCNRYIADYKKQIEWLETQK